MTIAAGIQVSLRHLPDLQDEDPKGDGVPEVDKERDELLAAADAEA